MRSKPMLVVTRRLTQEVETRIASEFDACYNPHERPFSPEELLAAASSADALLVNPVDQLDASFFRDVSSSVKVIATFSVGYDHIDLLAAAERGIVIANTPDVLTDATADMAMLLMLGASRRAYEGQMLVRSAKWKVSKPTDLLGSQLTGKVLGIYGMGRIGRAVAHRARGFGMTIHYTNRHELPPELAQEAIYHADVRELLSLSNFLSLHAPSTAETRHFICAETLALLPPGAILVNTARGPLIKDDDLIAALMSGHIAAAGLDVYEGEPAVHPGYLGLANLFLMPHLGSATLETRTAMGMLAVDNIEAVLAGKPALTPCTIKDKGTSDLLLDLEATR